MRTGDSPLFFLSLLSLLSLLSFFYLLTTTGTTDNNLTLVYVVVVVLLSFFIEDRGLSPVLRTKSTKQVEKKCLNLCT